jgi:hypothetical protein
MQSPDLNPHKNLQAPVTFIYFLGQNPAPKNDFEIGLKMYLSLKKSINSI